VDLMFGFCERALATLRQRFTVYFGTWDGQL